MDYQSVAGTSRMIFQGQILHNQCLHRRIGVHTDSIHGIFIFPSVEFTDRQAFNNRVLLNLDQRKMIGLIFHMRFLEG